MKATARLLALYFFLGSLLPGSDYSQLTRLHSLFEHYQDHQQWAAEQGQPMNFSAFLLEHFLDADGHEDSSHQDLPLKHLNHFDFMLAQAPLAALPYSIALPSLRVLPLSSLGLSSSFLDSIFRPPMLG